MISINMLVSKEISNNGISWLVLDLGICQKKLIAKIHNNTQDNVMMNLKQKMMNVLFYMLNATCKE